MRKLVGLAIVISAFSVGEVSAARAGFTAVQMEGAGGICGEIKIADLFPDRL